MVSKLVPSRSSVAKRGEMSSGVVSRSWQERSVEIRDGDWPMLDLGFGQGVGRPARDYVGEGIDGRAVSGVLQPHARLQLVKESFSDHILLDGLARHQFLVARTSSCASKQLTKLRLLTGIQDNAELLCPGWSGINSGTSCSSLSPVGIESMNPQST